MGIATVDRLQRDAYAALGRSTIASCPPGRGRSGATMPEAPSHPAPAQLPRRRQATRARVGGLSHVRRAHSAKSAEAADPPPPSNSPIAARKIAAVSGARDAAHAGTSWRMRVLIGQPVGCRGEHGPTGRRRCTAASPATRAARTCRRTPPSELPRAARRQRYLGGERIRDAASDARHDRDVGDQAALLWRVGERRQTFEHLGAGVAR
jgi:hypothetical protein